MPTIVPSSTTQSATFTRRSPSTRSTGSPRARTSRRRTGRRCARCRTRGRRAARPPSARRAAARVSLAERDEIREQPIRARDCFGELAEPCQAGVDEVSLAVPRREQAALERRLAGVAGREDRGEALVPLSGEVETALLHPALEVRRRDAIRRRQHGMLGRQDRHRRVLIRHAVAREAQVERREPALAQAVQGVVLRDDGAARLDVGEQRGQALGEIRPHVEGADADDHPVEAAQPFRREVGAGQRRDLVSHLLEGGGHVVAGAREVADVAAAKSRTPARNRNETGAMTVSRRRSAGLAGSAAGLGSPAITSVCPPTSKTYSSGNVGGFSARPMSDGSFTSNRPAVPSVRSQYGWLGGVLAGTTSELSRTTGWFGCSSMGLLIAR